MALDDDLLPFNEQPDNFDNVASGPAQKLEADQYIADDLEGVTENLSGSGNLNYLALQQAQTDGLVSGDSVTPFNDSSLFEGLSIQNINPVPTISQTDFGRTPNVFGRGGADSDISTDRGLTAGDGLSTDGVTSDAGFASTTAGSLGVSNFAGNAANAGRNIFNASNFAQDGDTVNIIDEGNGADPGENPPDNGDGGDTVYNYYGDTINIGNIDFGDITLGDINFDFGDTIINIDETAGDIITVTVTEVSDIVQNTISSQVTNILDVTENLTNNIFNTVNNILVEYEGGDNVVPDVDLIDVNIDTGDILNTGITLEGNVDLSTGIVNNLVQNVNTVINGGDILNVLNITDENNQLDIDLNIDDLDIPVIDFVDGADLELNLGLLNGGENQGDDTDLALDLGLGQDGDDLVVNLDPIEGILGDIDLDSDLGDVTDPLLDPVLGAGGGELGGLIEGVLPNADNETDNAAGDSDITLDLGNETIDIPLDLVENLTGDVDLNVNEALDALTGTVEDVFDNIGDALGGLTDDGPDENPDTDVSLGTGAGEDFSLGLDFVEDLAGDVDADLGLGLGLAGTDTDAGSEDTDLALDLDTDIVDSDLLNGDVNINLDPVESVLGDIDVDVNAALDALGDTADGIVDIAPGGSGDDTFLAETGDAVSDLVDGPLSEIADNIGIDLSLDTENADTDNNAGDSDVALNLGDDTIDIPLDPVENLTGDVDLSLNLEDADGGVQDVLDGLNFGGGDDSADSDLTLTLGDETIDISLDPVESVTGDIDLNVNDTVENTVEGIGDTASQTVEAAAETTEQVVTDNVDGVLSGAGSLLGNIFGESTAEDDTDLNVGLETDVVDTDIIDITGETVVNPVEDIAGDIDAVVEAEADIFDAENTANETGDTDIHAPLELDVADNDLAANNVEIGIDPVESFIGDIDANADIATDVIGDTADALVDDVPGGTGEDTLLSHVGDGLETFVQETVPGMEGDEATTNADQDVTLDTGVDVLDETIANTETEINLDPVEAVLDDIDVDADIDAALLDPSGTANTQGDHDLNIQIGDAELDVPLDFVESITGDLDATIDADLALLGDSGSGNIIEGVVNGVDDVVEGLTSWPESTVFDNALAEDLASVTQDILPGSGGNIGEGLGNLTDSLNSGSDNDGFLGGAFGW